MVSKKEMKEILKEFGKFEDIRTNIDLNMLFEDKEVKTLDDDGMEDVKEIDFEKEGEFGIHDLGGKVEIGFEFGTIKINKAIFDETLKRYLKRNKFIEKLKKEGKSPSIF